MGQKGVLYEVAGRGGGVKTARYQFVKRAWEGVANSLRQAFNGQGRSYGNSSGPGDCGNMRGGKKSGRLKSLALPAGNSWQDAGEPVEGEGEGTSGKVNAGTTREHPLP